VLDVLGRLRIRRRTATRVTVVDLDDLLTRCLVAGLRLCGRSRLRHVSLPTCHASTVHRLPLDIGAPTSPENVAGPMDKRIVERHAARAIVLRPDHAVLLQHIEAETGRAWILPGGGLAAGETHEQALSRELAEEVGLRAVSLGPWVWRRTAEFSFHGVRYRQQERIFLARAEPFDFDHAGLEEVEMGVVLDHRWWTVDEIEAASGRVFWPRRLAQLLRPLVMGEVPREPIEIED
jgi:ADP-ribose pyrophosphatase YjhB (NUDIX family)